LRHEQFGQENGAVGRARGRVVLVDVLCWDLVDVSLQWRRRRVMIAQRRKMVIMIISVRKMLVAIVWWRRRVVLVVRCRRMVIMVIRVRRMRDVSVILHSGVIPVIIGCVSHNLRPAVRELDRVLALGGVVSLALRVVMDVPGVGVCHVVSEVVICWHI